MTSSNSLFSTFTRGAVEEDLISIKLGIYGANGQANLHLDLRLPHMQGGLHVTTDNPWDLSDDELKLLACHCWVQRKGSVDAIVFSL